MQIRQRQELRKLLAPQLQQSLKILTLPIFDLKETINQELESNPVLEEVRPKETVLVKVDEGLGQKILNPDPSGLLSSLDGSDTYLPRDKWLNSSESDQIDLSATVISKRMTLQEVLMRQLGMFASDLDWLKIGQIIIGNIDENGYLKASIEEIAATTGNTIQKIQEVLDLIQQFEPVGVAARNISECLLIQLKARPEKDTLAIEITKSYLELVAKKQYKKLAKILGQSTPQIEAAVKIIEKLDPKPGRNYSISNTNYITPDVIVSQIADSLKVTLNNEQFPKIRINRKYLKMLKDKDLDPKTREYLTEKFKTAIDLVRSLIRRQSTLKRIADELVKIQQEALKGNLSLLKPLNFSEIASRLDIHETTVCRAIMNKYMQAPCGVVAFKDLFPSSITRSNKKESVSSSFVKKLIKDSIDKEDPSHPLSDEKLCKIIRSEKELTISRRTIAKYREELNILSSPFRRKH